MWWFIKGSFWFSLVLVLLPVFSSGSSDRLANAPPVEMFDAFSAATGAYAYLTNMCSEKPDVCEKGGKTFVALGYRAREGARVAFDYLNEKFADKPAALASAEKAPAVEKARPAEILSPKAALSALASTLAPAAADAEKAVNGGIAAQAMPPAPGAHKPQPYRPPVTDAVVTGTVMQHVPVPLPRPLEKPLTES